MNNLRRKYKSDYYYKSFKTRTYRFIILFCILNCISYVRCGVSPNIDPKHRGFENWDGSGDLLLDCYGKIIADNVPSSTNSLIWADGNLIRELLDVNKIDKRDWICDATMHDPAYRLNISWQNIAYTQSSHTGFYLDVGMKKPVTQNIITLKVSSSSDTVFKGRQLVYSDDFIKPLNKKIWISEIAPYKDSQVYSQDGKLVLDTRGGVTVWLDILLKGNHIIEFDRKVVMGHGINDRLSDMNFFWLASDPRNPNLFTRNGVLERYDTLRLYYASIGGNYNTTSRFRKYEGDGKRTLIEEYIDKDHLLEPNHNYKVKIIVKNNITSLWIDGKCYFSYKDSSPLPEGYFGFRSTWSHQEISNFRCYNAY